MNDLLQSLRSGNENADWTIGADGTMRHKKNGYLIEGFRLSENWLDHMSEKRWVDMNTFVPAYITACTRAGVTAVCVTY